MFVRRTVLLAVLFGIAAALPGCASRHSERTGAAAASPDPSDVLARGKTVYSQQCAACHGAPGTNAPIGPSLRNERMRRSSAWIYAEIADPQPPMPKLYPAQLSKSDLRAVSAYVDTL